MTITIKSTLTSPQVSITSGSATNHYTNTFTYTSNTAPNTGIYGTYGIHTLTGTGGGGGSGTTVSNQVLYTNNTYSNTNWHTSFVDGADISPASIEVHGDAEFKGNIKIKGRDLMETLSKIEQRLAVLHFNPELEEKWENLKSLGDQYRAMEKDILEKEDIWAKLKA
jgi:hypothetical protein